ncbi:hypothetical protein BU23DRAFT_184038 [Bimuria novae-zelandiae CBS 107.79]|uniref:Uncharacterized protein n=1 Tax=Bimuria novae-zelandiae CBS 107.79 TaxID=1447943 RepID=A0A6A5V5I2_9PLEO|nr:hypothetical protein BU23DRAFT_184038 [Bimuria novae-zelandiae CBS 107.79]
MSSDRSSPPLPSPGASDRRRSSVTGQTFRDIFGQGSAPGQTQPFPGPITTAAVNAQRRRLSLTTIGLSGSPNQTSPFQARPRTESLSSANSGSVDESPFEDDPTPSASSNPATPFARRLSFGARAMRDVRQGNGSVGNPNGEGYSFAENLRTRAERTSMSAPKPILTQSSTHQRAKSVAIMEPPVREMPKQPKVPDAMQERILKGDFYMD